MLDARAPECRYCPLGRDKSCILRSDAVPVRLDRVRRQVRYAAGESVAQQGEAFRYFGVVTTGALRTVSHDAGGHVRVLALHLPGMVFGQPFSTAASHGVEASTETTACVTDRTAFEDSLAVDPALMRSYSMALLQQLRDAQETLEMLAPYRASERIARFMISHCMEAAGERDTRRSGLSGVRIPDCSPTPMVRLPAPRRDIAALLGTTLETISRFLHDMVRRRILRIRDARHFTVLDFGALRQVASSAAQCVEIPNIKIGDEVLLHSSIQMPIVARDASLPQPQTANPVALTVVNLSVDPSNLVRRQ